MIQALVVLKPFLVVFVYDATLVENEYSIGLKNTSAMKLLKELVLLVE